MASIQSLKWGIIGCGDVTEVKSGPAFNLTSQSSLIAVMRRNGEKAQDYAKRHGVPRWYDDADRLIRDPDINAIYIATPPSSHLEYAIRCVEAGKFVYLEKPMALNTSEAEQISNIVRQYQAKLTVAHYRRAQPMFQKIRVLLSQDVIGPVRFISLKMLQPVGSDLFAPSEENWRVNPAISGGGLFHDLAPHQLDLMTYFFGKVSKAHGVALNQAGLYPADDLVAGELLFENGIIFQGTWCFTVSPQDKTDLCEIVGAKGKISFPVFGHEIRLSHGDKEDVIEFPPLKHVQQPMIEKVSAFFLGDGPNPCSAEDAITSMEIIDTFTNSH
jgi:predicted dehydrogenase